MSRVPPPFRLAAVLTAILALAGCASALRSRIYLPDPPAAPAPWPGRSPSPVTVTTADGVTLSGYYWAPEGPPRTVVVYFPGNGGNLEIAARRAEPLGRAPGRGVLVASWRGYPPNPGRPSEAGLQADGAAFIAEARRLQPGSRLVIFGYSLGGGVALEQAGRTAVDAVATLGVFTRLADQAPAAARPLLPDRYDNLAAVRRISAPILLIHGTADEVVPYAAMQRLDQASGGRATTITLEGADHHPDMTVVAAHVDRWLAGLFGGDA